MKKSVKQTRETAESSRLVSCIDGDEVPETFSQVVHNETFRESFRDYLKIKMAVESLNFFECIEFYETIDSSKQDKVETAGLFLVENFLKQDKKFTVNVAGVSRDEILTAGEFTAETFSKVKNEVFVLLSQNFFDNFKNFRSGIEVEDNIEEKAARAEEYYHDCPTVFTMAEHLGVDPPQYYIYGEDEHGSVKPVRSAQRGRTGTLAGITRLFRVGAGSTLLRGRKKKQTSNARLNNLMQEL